MKNLRVALLVAVFPVVLVVLGIATYLLWPVWFPKYMPGSCVKNEQLNRVYLVVGYDDWFKGSGVPAIILQPSAKDPSAFQLSEESRIHGADATLVPVTCPRAGVQVIGPVRLPDAPVSESKPQAPATLAPPTTATPAPPTATPVAPGSGT